MFSKYFDCNNCKKAVVCKYTEEMQEFHKKILKLWEEQCVSIEDITLKCLEYEKNSFIK